MAWHVATGDLNNTGIASIVAGTYDGHVLRVETTNGGSIAWDYALPSGAAVFDVAIGDFNNDGQKQVVVASADGAVYALSAAGTLLWKTDLQGGKALQTKVAHLQGPTGPASVVATNAAREVVLLSVAGVRTNSVSVPGYPPYLRVGNFLGDGKDTIFVMATSGASGKFSLHLYGSGLGLLSRLGQGVHEPFSPPEGQYGFDCDVAAVTGSGRDELVSAYGAASYGANLALGPVPTLHFDTAAAALTYPQENISYNYRSERVAVGNLTASAGLETMSVNGPDLALFAADGHLLGSVQIGNPTNTRVNQLAPGPVQPRGFTDAAFLPGSSTGRMVFASSPSGDDNLYIVTFDSTWQSDLRNLNSPYGSGVDATVLSNLKALEAAVDAWTGPPAAGQPGPYSFTVSTLQIEPGTGATRAQWAVGGVQDAIRRYPRATYPRLQFVAEVRGTVSGAETSYSGGPWPRDRRYSYNLTEADVRAYAEYMESHNTKFWLWAGHGDQPYISAATAENVLKTYAPTSCLGFLQSENENLQTNAAYLQHVIKPQLDIAKKYNKHLVMREKDAYWAAATAIPAIGNVLFGGDYKGVLLPSVEESNTRTPDLNLAARVGPWLDGYVDGWNSHLAPDWFRFDVMDSNAYPLSGHASLRYFVAETSLGSSSFSNLLGAGAPRIEEGVDPFLKLLGKGIIAPPSRDRVKGVSPILVRVRRTQVATPPSRFVGSANNNHHMSDYDAAVDGPSTAWAFGQQDCFWGLAPTAPTDASTYLWGRRNQFDNHIPRTPYGFVAVLPGATPLGGYPWSNIRWETDGDQMYRQGIGYGATATGQQAAKTAMLADLQAAAAGFPFTVSGDPIFSQIVQQSPNTYFLYLIDPGFLTPADRHVTVSFTGAWEGRDRLASGTSTTVVSPALALTVPAGTLRIMELTRQSTGGGTGGGGSGGGAGGGPSDTGGGTANTGGGEGGEFSDDPQVQRPTAARGCSAAPDLVFSTLMVLSLLSAPRKHSHTSLTSLKK